MPYELDDKKNLDISPSTSPFDTHNFPTSVNDISTWLDGDKYIFASTEESNQANTSVECDQVNTVTPEIKIKQEINTSTSNYSLHFHLATFHFSLGDSVDYPPAHSGTGENRNNILQWTVMGTTLPHVTRKCKLLYAR